MNKQFLLNHFRKFDSLPIFFYGSGMSRRYLGLENWNGLLKKFSDLIGADYLRAHSNSGGDSIQVATYLAEEYSKKWWDSESGKVLREKYESDLVKRNSPIKVSVADYLLKSHENTIDQMKSEIDLLRSVNVDAVLTTNWDCFLESVFSDYEVFVGQDDLIAKRSVGVAEIFKIHGCSKYPNSLVFDANDYGDFEVKNPYLVAKLTSFFVENPIIFLGYSITDPHVMDILERVASCFPSEKTEMLRERLIFVEWEPGLQETSWSDTLIHKKLPFKHLKVGDYVDLFSALAELPRRLPASLFRKVKDQLHELVLTGDPKGQVFVMREQEGLAQQMSPEIVIGWGAISKIKAAEAMSKQGLLGVDREYLLRDIVFDNGLLDANAVLFDLFPQKLKGNTHFPIFKYINFAGLLDSIHENTDICDGLRGRLGNNLSTFQSKGHYTNKAERLISATTTYEELYAQLPFKDFLALAPFVNESVVDLDYLNMILKRHFDEECDSPTRSMFAKLVCVYDYLKYKLKRDQVL